MRFRAIEVAAATGGRLVGPDVELDGVSFDSRSVQPGQLFVPLVAERDGHEFIADALARGAGAYLTSRPAGGDGTAIEVDDTLQALMDLGRGAAPRRASPGRWSASPASVGKTSTKDLAVGRARRQPADVRANERSFNNDQGLPTTILATPDRHRGAGARDGHARPRRDRPAVRDRRAARSASSPASPRPTATGSAASTASPGPRASWSRRCRADGMAILNADDARVAGDGGAHARPRC